MQNANQATSSHPSPTSYVRFVLITPSPPQLVPPSVSVRMDSSAPLQTLQRHPVQVTTRLTVSFTVSYPSGHFWWFLWLTCVIYFLSKLHLALLVTSRPLPCQGRAGWCCPGVHRWWPEAAAISPTGWRVRSVARTRASRVVRRSVLRRVLQTFGTPQSLLVAWILILTTRLPWRLVVESLETTPRGLPQPSPLLWIIRVRNKWFYCWETQMGLFLFGFNILIERSFSLQF